MNENPVQVPSRRVFLDAAMSTAVAAVAVTSASASVVAQAAGPRSSSQAATPLRRRFDGKVVMVTGGTSGIGRAAVSAFAAEGAKVMFCGRTEPLGAEVERQVRAAGGDATYLRADVRQEKDVKRFIDETMRLHGRIDAAFNNAGITIEKKLHEFSAAEWDEVQNTNVRGVFLAMKYQIPHMAAAGRGNIVVTSSTQAVLSSENRSAYGASKRALVGLVQAAAFEYADKGLRINALLPGTTDTPFVRRVAGMESMPDFAWKIGAGQWAKSHVPGLKRMATAEEMAAAAVMLASDDHPYLLGTSFIVDGGQSTHAP